MKSNIGIILAFLWVLLVFGGGSGCAMYDVESCEDGVCKRMKVYSARKFKTVRMYYDGNNKLFFLEAGEVSTDGNIVKTLADTATAIVP